MNKAVRAQLEDALEAAKDAKGNTVLVLVSPRQAERLFLAMKIADIAMSGKTDGLIAAVFRYKELSDG